MATKSKKLADFSQPRDSLQSLFYGLGTPEFSETNLYDALIYTLDQMRGVHGRKAISLISSGLDSFSKASYQDGLKAAGESDCPIYLISIARTLRDLSELHGLTSPAGRVDWEKAEKQLRKLPEHQREIFTACRLNFRNNNENRPPAWVGFTNETAVKGPTARDSMGMACYVIRQESGLSGLVFV
jgi:hypothetical protein